MRLFVAIEISATVATTVLDLISRLRATAARLAPLSRITWVTAERLHITIRFIGHVEESKADAVCTMLTEPLGERFDLTIAGVGTFPRTGGPRVIWAGLTAGRPRLMALETLVNDRLAVAGVPPEERPFNPHLTLARVRDAAGLRSPALVGPLNDLALGTTPVDAITLFESRLSPKGPTYVALQRTALRAGPST